MSFDVVPAFAKNKHYEIPDTATSAGWTETNPEVHYDLAPEQDGDMADSMHCRH